MVYLESDFVSLYRDDPVYPQLTPSILCQGKQFSRGHTELVAAQTVQCPRIVFAVTTSPDTKKLPR